MAAQTPCSPQRGASQAASVMRTPHMLTRFIRLGARVSPAPRSAPAATMEAAKRGSAKASMRSTCTPRLRTAASGVSIVKMAGARRNMTTAVPPMTAMPSAVDSQANRRARRFSPAPRLWPTRVVAAAEMPYPGI